MVAPIEKSIPELINELCEMLKKLESDPSFMAREWLMNTEGMDPTQEEFFGEVENLACQILIQDDGHPNFKAMPLLKAKGYTVERGEHDSFGWLSGIIHTGKGKIVYG